ncbi:uncharacterized protein [Antedon mediterranea]|uniref:uncharacterized protein n=1 Tax=Antedon mediterranea TaxID=105859 RepID=UPI003AF843B3
MDHPREIVNTIKQFEEAIEQVEEFFNSIGRKTVVLKPAVETLSLAAPPPGNNDDGPRATTTTSEKSTRPRTSEDVTDSARFRPSPSSKFDKNRPKDIYDETDHNRSVDPDPLNQAKKHLVDAYAINSVFWMYLCVQGVDPRGHIKHELERIKKYMNLIKQVVDKQKAPKLNVKASKRLIRGAMFDTNETNKKLKKE